ncbi:GAF domain-containing sensor histidine kinase [Nocardioides alpinus]|uniref:GAF domain-containing sensor histidine kinase n=1 Tax=Nocardioides alpinus TaxID=748909 RepID=UPI001E2FA872|nr:GAF domain-containing sensor histidine kinase [Nocardioides alpinus]
MAAGGAVVQDDIKAWTRPRGQAWGNEAQRAVLHAIAEDVARRAGYRVAGIEAMRSDGFLEFVAIAGNPDASVELLGRASPFMLHRLIALGTPLDGWVHTPGERLDDDDREYIADYGHIPDRPSSSDGADAWRPEDQLVRLLKSEASDLRALLYLDEPLSGLRPTPESIAAVNAEIHVMYDAVVSIVERELYGEQVRMLTQARTAMQSVRPGMGVDDFLSEMSRAMVEVMAVDSVDVLLAGHRAPDLEPHTAVLEDQMRQVWLKGGHLVVEPTQTWGFVGQHAVPTPEVMSRLMRRLGLGSWLLVPIGMGEEYLGTMGLGRKPGGDRWIDSEINAVDAVASDLASLILDSRLMERERTLNASLRDLVAHRRDMVNTLAHELRTPVSVLRMHLELFAEDPTAVEAAESLAAMDRSARRIENMIDDLMALATESDPGRATPHEPVDLSTIVRESCDFLAPVAEATGLELVTDIPGDLVITGEAAGIQRMATNLLSNAFKYTQPGGRVTLSLAREAVEDRDGIRLICADDGIGIAESEVGQVFTPFFRSSSKEARERPGTGLGLAIIERVVQRHQGTVEVSSEVGVGTAFSVWLPLSAGADVR